jgi:RNase P/RNase MRP subunit p30
MFDDVSRVICMTNIINIIKATGGKNIIFSSHADNFKYHRSPYDVAALAASIGLNKHQTLAAMKENVQAMIRSAFHRKFFKGTIKQISEVVVKKLNKKIQKHREGIKKLIKAEQ